MDTQKDPSPPGVFRRFLHNWQEPVIWLPLLGALVLMLFFAIPRLDPRSGIDGFGDLLHLATSLIALAAISFCAWLGKRTYLTELEPAQEQSLRAAVIEEHSVAALTLLIVDRLEWAGLLLLAYAVLH